MPLYEYLCKDCSTRFDALVSRPELGNGVACRQCQSQNVRRLVSSFAMVGGYDDEFVPRKAGAGVGCCGGSCGCSH